MKVAVIGAGYAGLVSGRELQREGHDVVVFEKADQVGGTWAYDPRVESDPMGLDPNREVVHSSMFRSLRVNLPRQLMGFLDYPFTPREDGSGDPRTFPGHEEVLRFLNDFARDFGLLGRIRLAHEVVRVEPLTVDGNDRWAVEWRRRGGESEVEIFEAVVICNGKYTEPLIAQFPGVDVWPGVQIHSHNYRVPDPFQDQVVVIIGNGPSAIEIIRDVKSVAKQVHQVTRTKIVRDFVKAPGTIRHPMIKCAHKDGKLDFEDGSSMFADAIIHCTGYKCHIPFLRTNGIVKVGDFRVRLLYQHIFPPKLAPRLSFVGLPHFTANVVMMELQSKWVAKVLSGKLALPSEEEMSNSARDFYKQMEEAGLPESSTHKLSPHCEYEKWIVSELGLRPLEKWRVTLFPTLLTEIVREHGAQYLDTWDVHKWIQETESSSLICKI